MKSDNEIVFNLLDQYLNGKQLTRAELVLMRNSGITSNIEDLLVKGPKLGSASKKKLNKLLNMITSLNGKKLQKKQFSPMYQGLKDYNQELCSSVSGGGTNGTGKKR
ncbi:hypothetical protein DN730_03930 [Marinomonas piezotolerans]|uniref:Uncharacterized protein n=1 Tax=Marinomonas piezotolerans TaxID=2213058 RepID=A0A370UEP2_9GAMM|nr:hypothetical protein [Marinomonas piezotolerans]RDL46195.1 hypothetical protein DN730_03930 [Marinomonas piezotolerans]